MERVHLQPSPPFMWPTDKTARAGLSSQRKGMACCSARGLHSGSILMGGLQKPCFGCILKNVKVPWSCLNLFENIKAALLYLTSQ